MDFIATLNSVQDMNGLSVSTGQEGMVDHSW